MIQDPEEPNTFMYESAEKCDRCDYPFDGVTNLDGPEAPDDGSISICLGCGKVTIFSQVGDGVVRRNMTDEEEAEIMADERVQFALFARERVMGKWEG